MRDAWMVISTVLSTVHWLPVIGVTVLSFVIGAIWHLPFLFGRVWAKETNPDGAGRKVNRLLVFGFSGILLLIAFTNLSLVVAGTGAFSGLLTSLQISVVWVATAIGTIYLFSGRSWRLMAIDSGLYIVLYSLGGLALGAF